MRKALRWFGWTVVCLVGLLAIALLFAFWVWFFSARLLGATHEAAPERLPAVDATQLAEGGRQARILGCYSCHGEGLRGRMMFEAPNVVRVWVPNLVELAARTTDQQLAQGIRQGIGHDGRALYVMPSALYSRLNEAEVAALVAYIRSLPPGGDRLSNLEWGPIGRFALAMGGFPSQRDRMEEFRTRLPFDAGPATAFGRRLVSLQCAGCHAPDLSGDESMPDVFSPGLSIAGAYSRDQFRVLMRTGRPPGGRDLGMMREAALNELRHYTDAEIDQIYDYLQARARRVTDPPPRTSQR
ncbi:c-type cytochrome [Sphingosinicella sp.]|uniref:c-type cytochrome n=1 Tax=Sphingosinicella sp. TaxID=1917971 RepID=UPI004037B7E8